MCKCAWEEPLVACFMNMRAKQVSIQHVIIVRGVYSKGGGLLLRLRSNPLLECQKSQTRPYLDKSLYTPLPGLIPVYAPTWTNPCIRPYGQNFDFKCSPCSAQFLAVFSPRSALKAEHCWLNSGASKLTALTGVMHQRFIQ